MEEILGLDRGALDRARLSRDARFDGRFFIAITSTGIYCRPICPSPVSKNSNVRYYATAAAAAEAGFRPCLRCRPEAAPGTPGWLGTSAVVRRALRLIQEGALDEISVDELAARIGIGPRHLHRLFTKHVGASPIAVAQTRRLHFAKRLLDETDLPITQIALASGFGSLRRFNYTFQQTYNRAPRDLRRQRRGGIAAADADEVVLKLSFRPPYDWPQVRDFLAARAVPGVERVDERGYARTVKSSTDQAIVCVRALDRDDALELRVRGAVPTMLFQISSTARRMFDLSADPPRIDAAFKTDDLLAPLVKRRPGLRIPGAWDAFECAVRALLGEHIDIAAARTLAGRIVARVGEPVAEAVEGLTHFFPTPLALATADFGGLGVAASRAAAIRALACATHEDTIDFGAGVEEVVAALSKLPGFDSAAAQYVALCALGEPDAFPRGDLIVRRMAGSQRKPLTARELDARMEAWRPWRGYALIHLWQAAEHEQALMRRAS
ncbi:MAG TPA: AlkA N-terminal domain-containing protein [Steroidobacteraceae bacterium]|jgi:AraC family transcriptional regulator of adaptative response / DNA-3-methyladenine glycosylase II